MRANWICRLLAPLVLAAGVSACANGVQPGIVSQSPPQQQTASANPPYGQGQAPQGYQQNSGPSGGYNGGGYGGQGPNGGYQPVSAVPGDGGRVVSINEVSLGGRGIDSTAIGGILGALGGIAIGVGTGGGWSGGLLGGLLGGMGGAAAGSVFDQHGGHGRGIEVTVQRDDGSTVTIAQRDNGDIQLGDRVQIVQGRNGVAQAVRDTTRTYDPQGQYGGQPQYNPQGQYGGQYGGQPQYNPQGQYGGGYGGQPQYNPPQDYHQTQYDPQSQYPQGQYPSPQYHGPQSQQYSPVPQDYGSQQGPVYPQNNPRYGTLN